MRGSWAVSAGILLLSTLACGEVHTTDGDPLSTDPPTGGSNSAGTGGSAQQAAAPLMETDSGPTVLDPPSNGGSGGSQAETAPEPAEEFCDAPAKLLVPHCGGGSCHSNKGAVMGDFAMNTTQAYKYVDKASTRNADCGRIIDSQDYSKSFILIKLRGELLSNVSEAVAESDPVHCGGRMPVGSFVIDDDLIDCMASWLQQFQVQR